tara:strand:- start:342 stop:770 length:429 start_codon:yes stop_codon:yes gene_type:complete
MTYWNEEGKFQKAYNHFHNILVPKSGSADSPEGELLILLGNFYRRYYNDGDSYYDCIESLDYDGITTIRYIDSNILYKIETYLTSDLYNNAVDYAMKYIMIKNSNKENIWNPNTNKLVKISTPIGYKCLKLLDCSISYSSNM